VKKGFLVTLLDKILFGLRLCRISHLESMRNELIVYQKEVERVNEANKILMAELGKKGYRFIEHK
jgi:hypothetical protein